MTMSKALDALKKISDIYLQHWCPELKLAYYEVKEELNKVYLVVHEDADMNKESYKTSRIGDTIAEIEKAKDLNIDYDKDALNGDHPFQAGTFAEGFYDIDCYNKYPADDGEEYAGRIMIFYIGDEL